MFKTSCLKHRHPCTVLLLFILAFEATKDMQPSEQSNSERSVTPSTSDSSAAESETIEEASATEQVDSSATTCPATQNQETEKQHTAAQEEVCYYEACNIVLMYVGIGVIEYSLSLRSQTSHLSAGILFFLK